MSTKFEQLLDYLVNEEMDKANELFHEIVVEKSREIYENLISEEIEEESVDEEVEQTDEEMEQTDEETELDEMSDSLEYEAVDDDDDMDEPMGGDATDDLLGDVEADPEAAEDQAMMDIKNAIEELEAAFAELEAAQDSEEEEEFGDEEDEEEFGDEEDEEEFGDEEDEEEDEQMEETMGLTMENRRMTREYVEKVGNDWEKSSSMKAQGQHAGAGTGEKDGAPHEGKSVVASGANKPGPAGVNAKNLNQGATEGQKNTGTTPNKVNKGIVPDSGEKFASGIHNVDHKTSGVKTLSKVAKGHGAEKAGSGPGPVGSGTGDKAGQTSVSTVKQFLKPYSK